MNLPHDLNKRYTVIFYICDNLHHIIVFFQFNDFSLANENSTFFGPKYGIHPESRLRTFSTLPFTIVLMLKSFQNIDPNAFLLNTCIKYQFSVE